MDRAALGVEIATMIARGIGTDVAVVTQESSLRDLGVDSLTAVSLCMDIERQYQVQIFEPTVSRDLRVGEMVSMTLSALERRHLVDDMRPAG
ncbi:acyl carrier protein [Pinirhizobacter soli]|uniref:acyl carrier protein n=1 Tax=Pinirhizobacter soli TaxID=2786953 RepID=UPI00202A2CB8|nr:acyl carrier protein [Pinirhizobacter soli]